MLVEFVREGMLSRSLRDVECVRGLDVLLATEVFADRFSCMGDCAEAIVRNVDVESGRVSKVLSFGSG